jgi:arylsulfatase A-like enzyme
MSRLAAVALLLPLLGACTEEPRRPNVLLVTLDTTRADRLSCYGHDRETSPNLDRLAAAGVRFTDFVNVSSWTLPTHASLMTGLHPRTHGAHYDALGGESLGAAVEAEHAQHFRVSALPDEAVTLAEVLSDAGYATGGVGAGPWLKPVFGLGQGFELYDADVDQLSGRPASEVNAIALPFLREHAEEPFFLFLNYFDPHDPYEPPPGTAASSAPIDRYDAEIAVMDAALGEVLDELARLGVYDDTWIVIVTDHGEAFGEHGRNGHGHSLFEEEIRGALVIKAPADATRRFDPDERCQQVHLMPTLLDALGLSSTAPLDAEPLGSVRRPAVAELYENPKDRHYGVESRQRHLQAVYHGTHKLILSTRADDPAAGLFDLAADPGEREDLSARDAELHASLREVLAEWQATLTPPLDRVAPEGVDALTLEQLEALGYTGDQPRGDR